MTSSMKLKPDEIDKFEESLLNLKIDAMKLGRAESEIQEYSEGEIEYNALSDSIDRQQYLVDFEYGWILNQYLELKKSLADATAND